MKNKNIERLLINADRLRNKFGGIKTQAKTMRELNNEIDRVVYGIDRDGKELSGES